MRSSLFQLLVGLAALALALAQPSDPFADDMPLPSAARLRRLARCLFGCQGPPNPAEQSGRRSAGTARARKTERSGDGVRFFWVGGSPLRSYRKHTEVLYGTGIPGWGRERRRIFRPNPRRCRGQRELYKRPGPARGRPPPPNLDLWPSGTGAAPIILLILHIPRRRQPFRLHSGARQKRAARSEAARCDSRAQAHLLRARRGADESPELRRAAACPTKETRALSSRS